MCQEKLAECTSWISKVHTKVATKGTLTLLSVTTLKFTNRSFMNKA